MKSLLVGLLVIGLTTTVEAQSLEIGGVELHIGQSGSSARASLSTAYDVVYSEKSKVWAVFPKSTPDRTTGFIGTFTIKNDSVRTVTKWYSNIDQADLANMYTRTLRELFQLEGRARCKTEPLEFVDGTFQEIDTVCILYRLSLSLPYTKNGLHYAAYITIETPPN